MPAVSGGTPGADPRGGAERDALPRYYGKYPGLVVERNPSGGDGAHRGELLVRVPGILEEAEDDSPGAGAQRPIEVIAKPCFLPGFFHVPEEGQQVWVEFAAGDVNAPIWSGVWYPEDGTPASVEGERPGEDETVLRTASGQVVQLEDTAGGERLVLRDEANDNRVTLGPEGIRLETRDCSIELGTGTITITNGTHTLELGAQGTRVTDGTGGGPHPVVLEPVLQWLADWIPAHQHMGNMGGPTPLAPQDIGEAVRLAVELHAAGGGKSAL